MAGTKPWVFSRLALAVGLGLGACGGNDQEPAPRPAPPALPHRQTSVRNEFPEYVFEIRARPLARTATLAGTTVQGRGTYAVVVSLKISNRQSRPLRLDRMGATLQSRVGRVYDPVVADGRKESDPLFAVSGLAPKRTRSALVAYLVPRKDLDGIKLRVRDPARGQSFATPLF